MASDHCIAMLGAGSFAGMEIVRRYFTCDRSSLDDSHAKGGDSHNGYSSLS